MSIVPADKLRLNKALGAVAAPCARAEGESAGFDHVYRHPKAGSEPENRPHIGRHVRLMQRQMDTSMIMLALVPHVLQKALRMDRYVRRVVRWTMARAMAR